MRTRIFTAIKADMLFQFKQGFYLVYFILTLLYLVVFSQLNMDVIKLILPIILFIDPSILGLFFIGGILLLEKEQGILSLIYITPLKVWEFIFSKLCTLSLISLSAVLCISIIAYNGVVNYLVLIIGILLTSFFFTLLGFIIAIYSKSVNDFFVKMIPFMVLLCAPCVGMFFLPNLRILNLIPSIAALRMVWGAYHGISFPEGFFCFLYLGILTGLLLRYTYTLFQNKMMTN